MKRILIVICSIAVVLTIFISALHTHRVLTRNAVEKLYSGKSLISVLVAGTNSIRTNKFDFFAVVTVNPRNNYIGITYLPPSYRVELSDSGNEFDKLSNIDFSNFEMIRRSLLKNLKLNVPFYIAVNPNDISRFVDLIGGIDLFILDQFSDFSITGHGKYYFDGAKILKYINDVENNSIFLKYDRVQDIIMTLFTDKKKYAKYLSLKHVSKLTSGIRSNMYAQEMFSLAEILEKENAIISTVVPGSLQDGFYVVDDIAYQHYENDFLSQIVLGQESEYPIRLTIINATSQSGLARRMRNFLNRDMVNVLEFSSSPFGQFEKSIIIGRTGDSISTRKISILTGITNISYVTDNTQLINIMVILGNDISNIQESRIGE